MTPNSGESSEFHPPIEEYLEAIHTLREDGITVIQARIAESVGRSVPSVSQMLGRLEDDGYIYRQGRNIELTALGNSVAVRVVRKHRLAERLLVDVIGLEWHKAHMEAGRWEHVISDEVEGKLIALLGNPTTCPHGNPIPGENQLVEGHQGPHQRPLVDCKPGDRVTLARVTEQVEIDTPSLELLSRAGFITNSNATVLGVRPGGDIELDLESTSFVVPFKIASRIYVVPAA